MSGFDHQVLFAETTQTEMALGLDILKNLAIPWVIFCRDRGL